MTGHSDEFDESGLNLKPPPPGSEWVQGWYCTGCTDDLGEPGDPEPPTHCDGFYVAWEWMLASVPPVRNTRPQT